MAYYNGTKLLSMKDIDGNTPEVFISTSNRTGGKTTYFNRLMLNKYLRNSEKFMLIYRFGDELTDCAEKFFKDISGLFFEGHIMANRSRANGAYHDLYLDGDKCGYAVALNYADKIKRYSHMFSDTSRMLFDEFQSETNHYCANEVSKLMSIHTSVARGHGQMVRYVPLYMVSNPVSILNPYYVKMNISSRLTSDVRFLRGHGYVLEQGHNSEAENAQKSSGFNKAFAGDEYLAYSSEGVYLNDNVAFVERVSGPSRYVCTLRFENCDYGVREYAEQGIIYCDDHADLSFPARISVTTADHQVNYVMLKQNDLFISHMRYLFQRGSFRFKNLRCKDVILKALSY